MTWLMMSEQYPGWTRRSLTVLRSASGMKFWQEIKTSAVKAGLLQENKQ
jgi:hypothetical protein